MTTAIIEYFITKIAVNAEKRLTSCPFFYNICARIILYLSAHILRQS